MAGPTGNVFMEYADNLAEILRPADANGHLVVDLFSGAGGLALGFEAQGFRTVGFEMDKDACATYSKNLEGECVTAFLTPETLLPAATVLIGGPPCQPFSVVGKQTGRRDDRDGFPTFISAVKRLRPSIWMFENVRGMFYRSRPYLQSVLNSLESLGYIIDMRLLNAKDYGVPQNRERVVAVGHHGGYSFPVKSTRRVTAGEALGSMAYGVPPDAKFLTPSMDAYIARYEQKSKCIRPRDLHLDQPSRTVTCRNLAGATSDMLRIRLPDDRRRRLTVREGARLQSFPDWFEFSGAEASQFKQVGNAVAPLLAYSLAGSVRSYLGLPPLVSANVPSVEAPSLGQLSLF